MLKIANKKTIKKILSVIMLLVTLFSVIQPVFAASGSANFVAGQFASYMFTTDNRNTDYGIIIRKIINRSTKEAKTVFCAQHGLDIKTGAIHSGTYYTPTDAIIKYACKIAYFGWYQKYGDYVVDGGITAAAKKDYAYTQQFIWEYLGQSNATFVNSTYQNEYVAYKNDITNKINNMQRKPSFSDNTITLDVGQTTTLTDSNGVLADYSSIDKTINGIRFVHNQGENTITLTVNNDCTIEDFKISDDMMREWGLIKEQSRDYDTTLYIAFPGDVQDQIYSLHYNDPVTMAMRLKINLLGNIELSKLDTEKNLIDGAKVRVTGDNFNQLVEVKNGKIVLEKLRRGIYTVKEEYAPEGYLLNTESYKVEVKPNQTTTQVIVDSEPTATLTIIKEDSETGNIPQGDATFSGATYEVYAMEDIYNKAKTKKYYSNGDLVATRVMNEQGKTDDIKNLPLGLYKVKETISSEGYLIDTNEYQVKFEYADQNTTVISKSVTSHEIVKKMQVQVFKSGIKANSGLTPGLKNVEFTFKLYSDVENAYAKGYTYAEVWNGIDESGNKVEVNASRVAEAQKIAPTYDKITTDEDGYAYSNKKLPYGKYIGKETITPKDYETASDFCFSITQDESEVKEIAKKVKKLVVNNEQLETYIKLMKKDLKTGKLVTMSSTTFKIKATEDICDRATGKIIYKKGEEIKQKVGNTTYTNFTTNAENIVVPDGSYNNENDNKGTVTTPLLLPVGIYEVAEIKEPEGFLQLEKNVTFKVEGIRNYDKDQDGDYVKEIVIENEQPTGTLIVDKTIALRDDVDTSLINIDDLSEIQFKLSAKEDIIDMADGSVIYKKGTEVDTYNLDKNGDLIVTNLPIGVYELEEVKTLEGLVLNTTKYEVKLTQTDLVTKVYEETLEITNDTTLVEFSKQDITGEKELVGAHLSVLDENENIIDEWISTEVTHKIEGLIAGKWYTLRENIAPDKFVKSTDIKFKIEDTNEIQKVTMIDKIVEISKVDIAGEEIEGATLIVTSKRTKNIVDRWVSGKESHKVTGLAEGEIYILHEEIVVDGYVKATDIEFTVTTDKETQRIEMIDKIVEVSKTDFVTGEEIADAKLKVLDENDNIVDEWTSTKEPHRVIGLEEGKFYKLVETFAPYGYEITETIEFTVTTDKETQKIVMKDKPILNNIKLVKIDSNTKEVIKEKFTFGIYADPECTEILKEVNSNKDDGFLTFEDLRFGIFYIKELKEPKGYVLSENVIKLEINDKGIFINDIALEEKDGAYSFEFENAPMDTPKTGDERNTLIYAVLLGLSALGIIIISVVLYKKEKGKNK